MRNPSDLPPRSARVPGVDRGRMIFIIVGLSLLTLLIVGRLFASFYVDYLWFGSVDRTDVFWGSLATKLVLFLAFALVFIALAVVNLLIADRLAPTAYSANTHPVVERFHDLFGKRMRLLRIGIAGVLGLLVAAPAIARWQDWMFFRHSRSFGISDPQFGHDVGFYLFRLPFITFVVDWLYAALILVLLLTLAAHILNGGIVIAPPRPRMRAATKAHLAILLAVLALVKAADYWVTRYELTSVVRGIVRGPTYSVVNAQLPAVVLLTLIAVLVAGLYLSTLRTGSWRLPLIGSALWVVVALVGGIIYPAVIQALVVNPNQSEREQPYIERNVLATRAALGIDDVTIKPIEFGQISEADLTANTAPLQDQRLLNPVVMQERFRSDVGDSAGLTINDLDPDRYEFDGRTQQMIVGARELALDTIPNKSWQGRHLISTHGCGVVMAPAGQVDTAGRPVYQEAELDRRELYFSDRISGYAVARTDVREVGCPGAENTYDAVGGIRIDNGFRRLMLAIDNLDYNLLGSSAINPDSRYLAVRSVEDRARKIAPFLTFDNDPYPVVLDGKVLWVIDAYTLSNRYPYGESADRRQLIPGSGLDQPLNYVRNSVKVVVDAYTGDTDFYIADDADPVLRVWRAAFPDMFQPLSDMPAGLVDHLRYPEELFRLQTAAYSKYRLDPADFFDRDRAWSVAQAPADQIQPQAIAGGTAVAEPDQTSRQQEDFQGDGTAARFIPYYSMFTPPGSTTPAFELFRPFVPFSTDDRRRELQAFMTVSSDPATYGQMISYESAVPLTDGPSMVSDTMSSEPTVSREITLLNQQGSGVFLGDLQMIPVADGVVWLRPLYVAPDSSTRVQFRYLIASYRGRAAIGTSLQEALARLFPGFDTDLGDIVNTGTDPNEPTDPTDPTDPTGPTDPAGTPEELLAQADELFAEAQTELQTSGDLGAYQEKVDQAAELVRQALELLGG